MAKGVGSAGGALHMLGKWAFLIGFLVAILLGFWENTTGTLIVAIIGIIVGLLNVGHSETAPFLLSGVSLVIVSAFGGDALSAIPIVSNILASLLVLFVPATIIVAVKHVFSIARH